MVEKSAKAETRSRGRPRAYDPDVALQRARDAFWKSGYAGTSLDEISAATGMNRPSLRAAFGDKRAIYIKALKAYWDAKSAAMRDALHDRTMENALMRAYESALATYFSGAGGARGCFVVGTAITEAIDDVEIQRIVSAGFKMLDDNFEALFRSARAKGQLGADADPEALALLATATMQSLSVRARAGASRDELWALAHRAVRVICGAQ